MRDRRWDWRLDKVTLMSMCGRDIESKNEFIAELEQRGLDATLAKVMLSEFVSRGDADLKEMQCLSDVMDQARRCFRGRFRRARGGSPQQQASAISAFLDVREAVAR